MVSAMISKIYRDNVINNPYGLFRLSFEGAALST